MIKQLALVVILILGIAAVVFVIQKATQLKSLGYDVLDFVYAFHSSIGDAAFNPNLDINKDGVINTFDVLTDRYAQEATRSGSASDSGGLNNIIDDINEIEESSDSSMEDLEKEI